MARPYRITVQDELRTQDDLTVSVIGQYLGSAATFVALPETAAGNGDWALLTADDGAYDRGVYVYDGTAFSFGVSVGPDFAIGTTTGTVAAGSDTRFTDARTPTTHASSHADAGSDALTLTEAQVTGLVTDLGLKAADSAVAHLAGAETVAGVKTFSSSPVVPTSVVDTATTDAASTAFVVGQAAAATPVMDGTAAVGVSTRFTRADHVHPSDTTRASSLTATVRTAAYTAVVGDLVLADATSAGFTVTLPTAAAVGALVGVKKTDVSVNVVTVDAAGAGTVDGDPNATLVSRWAGAVFEHVGSEAWQIVAIMKEGSAGGAGAVVSTGTGILTAGTVTIADTAITANSVVRLSYGTRGGTPGAIYVSALTASTSFAVTSTSGTDTSSFRYDVQAY